MFLSNLFSNHCILQRHSSIPIWGWTEQPRTRIKAEINNIIIHSISGNEGKFLLRFPPMEAGGPYILTVTNLETQESIIVEDILIGDLWLASGQSNMQFTVLACEDKTEIKNSVPEQIRMFTIQNQADMAPQENIRGEWKLSTPESKAQFSAVANYFAQCIQDETNIPIGVISSSWGGTFIETWISREKLLQNPQQKPLLEQYERDAITEEAFLSNFPRDPGNQAFSKGWANIDFDDHEWDDMDLPSTWQTKGHNFSGAFWFRKRISIPKTWLNETLTLKLGAIDKHDVTYINGVKIGGLGEGQDEQYWNQLRIYTLPKDFIKSTELIITVRVFSFAHSGGLTGPSYEMELVNQNQSIPLTGTWKYKIEHNLGLVSTIQPKMGHKVPNSPYICFQNMIQPLLPAAIKGVIWYQGESNATEERAIYYERLIKELIEDWRFRFGNDSLPFIQVQLANFKDESDFQEESTWAILREAQCQALRLKNTGIAVAIDIGEAEDIHPKDKKTVGIRLAQWALKHCYDKDIIPGSPIYTHQIIEENTIHIHFKNTGSELKTRDGQEVQCLYIREENSDFKPAHVKISGTKLIVSHPEFNSPVAVRYAWADNPAKANLVNEINYPASPFKTD